jgi:hypothetical protein
MENVERKKKPRGHQPEDREHQAQGERAQRGRRSAEARQRVVIASKPAGKPLPAAELALPAAAPVAVLVVAHRVPLTAYDSSP